MCIGNVIDFTLHCIMIFPETLTCYTRQPSLATGHSFAIHLVILITSRCVALSLAQTDVTILSVPKNGNDTCNTSFMVIEEEIPFHEAQDLCRSYNYSGLAVFQPVQDAQLFLSVIDGTNRTFDDFWVGLSSISSEQTVRWGNGFYRTGATRGCCGKIDIAGQIDLVNCNLCLKSVCSDYVDFKQVFAIFDDEELEYHEASQKCLDKGYDRLAVLDSKEKMEYVINQMREITTTSHSVEVWIGMTVTASNHFQWASGEEVTWAEWHPSTEPDLLNTQKCVRLSYNAFATKRCTNRKHVVCENTPALSPRCPVHNLVTPYAHERLFKSLTPKIELHDWFPANSAEVISAQPVRSLIECVTQCADTSGCRSLAFHQGTHVCASFVRRYDASHISSSDLKYAPQWTLVSKCG